MRQFAAVLCLGLTLLLAGCAPASELQAARAEQAELADKVDTYKRLVQELPAMVQEKAQMEQELAFLVKERTRLRKKLGMPPAEGGASR